MAYFGIMKNLGEKLKEVELILSIEGTKLGDKQKSVIN